MERLTEISFVDGEGKLGFCGDLLNLHMATSYNFYIYLGILVYPYVYIYILYVIYCIYCILVFDMCVNILAQHLRCRAATIFRIPPGSVMPGHFLSVLNFVQRVSPWRCTYGHSHHG